MGLRHDLKGERGPSSLASSEVDRDGRCPYLIRGGSQGPVAAGGCLCGQALLSPGAARGSPAFLSCLHLSRSLEPGGPTQEWTLVGGMVTARAIGGQTSQTLPAP